jgi:hypothetical protein
MVDKLIKQAEQILQASMHKNIYSDIAPYTKLAAHNLASPYLQRKFTSS